MKRSLQNVLAAAAIAVSVSIASLSVPFAAFADQTVYITPTGKKYHSSDKCSGLNNSKNITSTTESEAINKGLERCSKCWADTDTPAASSSSSSSSTSSTSDPSSAVTTPSTTTIITTTTTTTTDSSSDTTEVVTEAVKEIKLSSKSIKLKKGKKLKIRIKNAEGKVKWSLSNKKAKIKKKKNNYIIIKGRKKGSVTVKAKTGGKTYKLKIKIK